MRKRVLSLILICLMMFNPLIVSASAVGDNGGAGNGSMTSTTDRKAWSSAHQGYRFYIINANLQLISNVVDFTFSTPTNIGTKIFDTRFGLAQNHRVKTMSELAQYTNSTLSEIPKPVYNNAGHGKEFQSWILRGLSTGNYGSDAIGGVTYGATGAPRRHEENNENIVKNVPETVRNTITKSYLNNIGIAQAAKKLTKEQCTAVRGWCNERGTSLFVNTYNLISYKYPTLSDYDKRSYAAISVASYNYSNGNELKYAVSWFMSSLVKLDAKRNKGNETLLAMLDSKIIPLASAPASGEESVEDAPIVLLLNKKEDSGEYLIDVLSA